jgi:hypothetical protein
VPQDLSVLENTISIKEIVENATEYISVRHRDPLPLSS